METIGYIVAIIGLLLAFFSASRIYAHHGPSRMRVWIFFFLSYVILVVGLVLANAFGATKL